MYILGIETSCDETAAAVIKVARGKINVLSNVVSSQINIHKKYGGVVPEVAAREHVLNILPVINEALKKSKIKRREAPRKIGAIAVTIGPGLITSLLVGVETAKVLSYIWQVPLIGINHIEGHIYANFVGLKSKVKSQKLKIFPAIILTVSGGHTMLVLMKGHGKYITIGQTRDDAAGEAFDKAAQLLGIGYPGGPVIAKYANNFIKQHPEISNSPSYAAGRQFLISNKIQLPRPMINSKNYDFSFSGLKTALLYKLKKDRQWRKKIPEYSHEFQQAVIDVLIAKTIKAAREYKVKTIMLAGGVSANKELRQQMSKIINNKLPHAQYLMPNVQYTTDNAAMIAAAGYFNASRKNFIPWQKIKVNCNLEL